MYNGIGLTSVRGSGTNGYVTKNMAHVSRQRVSRAKAMDSMQSGAGGSNPLRGPQGANPEILEHNRKREVEVKCLQLQEKLEGQGVADEDVERQVGELRSSLLAKLSSAGGQVPGSSSGAGGRAGETHSDAAAKQAESAAMKSALGIKADYVSGQAFDRELQQRQKEERMARREAEEQARLQAEEELARERAREEKRARKEARREEKEEKRKRRKEEKRERGHGRREDDEEPRASRSRSRSDE